MPNPRPGKPLHEEPMFEHPPVWIHESVAALLGGRRELKRRELLKLLDRIEVTPPSGRPSPAARRSRS
jgi:hypothetical protein